MLPHNTNNTRWSYLGYEIGLDSHPARKFMPCEQESAMKEFDLAVLRQDLAKLGLKKGDIGTIVIVHKGRKAYEVEFADLDGRTIALVTLTASQIRRVQRRDVSHVRLVLR